MLNNKVADKYDGCPLYEVYCMTVMSTVLRHSRLLLLEHQVLWDFVACLLQFQANEASLSEVDNLKHECQRLIEERQLNQSQVCINLTTNNCY